MPFKIHLIIVSILIILVLFLTKTFLSPKTEEIQIFTKPSPYTIIINRASWGLNCRIDNKKYDNYVRMDEEKSIENNVLSAVSRICNTKSSCSISADIYSLGGDPVPSCGYKELDIEYRCFSLDKIRVIKSSDAVVNINCDTEIPIKE